MNYQQQLQQNRLANGNELSALTIEWRLYRDQHYAYDPTFDYFPETFKRLSQELKRDGVSNYEAVARATLTDSNTTFWRDRDPHYVVYLYYLPYMYQDFKRNWKPRETDGLNYMWLTLNFPPHTVTIPEIQLEILRIVNLPVFKNCTLTYNYEFFGEGKGHPHIHMLVELNKTGTISISTLKAVIFQKKSLKSIMNLNYKMSWAKEYQDRTEKRAVYKQAYLLGLKTESKMESCEKDKEWRKINNLEELYIKENK